MTSWQNQARNTQRRDKQEQVPSDPTVHLLTEDGSWITNLRTLFDSLKDSIPEGENHTVVVWNVDQKRQAMALVFPNGLQDRVKIEIRERPATAD